MEKIKSFSAYILAVILFLFLVFSFVKMGIFINLIARTGIHATDWYSGGEIAYKQDMENYYVAVHKPVFRRVYGNAEFGFVQVSFIGKPLLPEIISQNISIEGYDLKIETDTKNLVTILKDPGPFGQKILWTYKFRDNSVNVRIELKNKK